MKTRCSGPLSLRCHSRKLKTGRYRKQWFMFNNVKICLVQAQRLTVVEGFHEIYSSLPSSFQGPNFGAPWVVSLCLSPFILSAAPAVRSGLQRSDERPKHFFCGFRVDDAGTPVDVLKRWGVHVPHRTWGWCQDPMAHVVVYTLHLWPGVCVYPDTTHGTGIFAYIGMVWSF